MLYWVLVVPLSSLTFKPFLTCPTSEAEIKVHYTVFKFNHYHQNPTTDYWKTSSD